MYTFVGPDLARRRQETGRSRAAARPRVVRVGVPRPSDDFRGCAEAFGALPWEVVLAVGPHLDLAALGELPPNVTAHRWVPQLGVLGRASAS